MTYVVSEEAEDRENAVSFENYREAFTSQRGGNWGSCFDCGAPMGAVRNSTGVATDYPSIFVQCTHCGCRGEHIGGYSSFEWEKMGARRRWLAMPSAWREANPWK